MEKSLAFDLNFQQGKLNPKALHTLRRGQIGLHLSEKRNDFDLIRILYLHCMSGHSNSYSFNSIMKKK